MMKNLLRALIALVGLLAVFLFIQINIGTVDSQKKREITVEGGSTSVVSKNPTDHLVTNASDACLKDSADSKREYVMSPLDGYQTPCATLPEEVFSAPVIYDPLVGTMNLSEEEAYKLEGIARKFVSSVNERPMLWDNSQYASKWVSAKAVADQELVNLLGQDRVNLIEDARMKGQTAISN